MNPNAGWTATCNSITGSGLKSPPTRSLGPKVARCVKPDRVDSNQLITKSTGPGSFRGSALSSGHLHALPESRCTAVGLHCQGVCLTRQVSRSGKMACAAARFSRWERCSNGIRLEGSSGRSAECPDKIGRSRIKCGRRSPRAVLRLVGTSFPWHNYSNVLSRSAGWMSSRCWALRGRSVW